MVDVSQSLSVSVIVSSLPRTGQEMKIYRCPGQIKVKILSIHSSLFQSINSYSYCVILEAMSRFLWFEIRFNMIKQSLHHLSIYIH